MIYTVKKEFEPILHSSNKNKSYKLVWDVLYYTRLFKYVHRTQYKDIRARLSMITSKKKISYLCELGYLKESKSNIYCTTDKALPILKEQGYNIQTLPGEPTGKGDINEINNTDVFIQASKLPDFYTILFPNFEYIIPDALLVQKQENRYKLTFLEIEAKKPKWNEWIDNKRDNYLRLSQDVNCYHYWKDISYRLNIVCPDITKLKFSVHFICELEKVLTNGFKQTQHF